jgi:hypothetical protein
MSLRKLKSTTLDTVNFKNYELNNDNHSFYKIIKCKQLPFIGLRWEKITMA